MAEAITFSRRTLLTLAGLALIRPARAATVAADQPLHLTLRGRQRHRHQPRSKRRHQRSREVVLARQAPRQRGQELDGLSREQRRRRQSDGRLLRAGRLHQSIGLAIWSRRRRNVQPADHLSGLRVWQHNKPNDGRGRLDGRRGHDLGRRQRIADLPPSRRRIEYDLPRLRHAERNVSCVRIRLSCGQRPIRSLHLDPQRRQRVGAQVGITNCHISNVVNGIGLAYQTGNTANMVMSGCYAINNIVTDISGRTGILLMGPGCTVSNNLIYNSKGFGIQYGDIYQDISFNEIHDVVTGASDAGAIYGGRSWVDRGTKIMYNYIHDLHQSGNVGIYLDDQMSGELVYGNIINCNDPAAKGVIGVLVGGGNDNVLQNNVFCFSAGEQ